MKGKEKVGVLMNNLPKKRESEMQFHVDGFPSAALKNSAILGLINTLS